MLKIIFWN